MKTRILTGAVLLLIVTSIFYVKIVYNNNYPIYFMGVFLSIFAMNEMISMKETERNLPFEIHLLAYLSVLYLSFYEILDRIFDLKVSIDIDILPLIFIVLIISMVTRKRFKMVDASFILFAVYYVGLSFHSLVYFLINHYYDLIYIILIAMLTDTFAYFVGSFFGKHKLIPRISPNKTIEGSVGGSVLTTIVVSLLVYFFIGTDNSFLSGQPILLVIILTFLLTIVSQFGDLVASAMKRFYKIKDFGNIFPGHGGVLDRLDSILFASLTYYYFIEIYLKFFN